MAFKAKAFPTFAKSFKQPNPGRTASGGHPGKLINPVHPKQQSSHVVSTVPAHKKTAVGQVSKPDYRPKVTLMKNNQAGGEKMVAGMNMGQSDINSEAIGSQMGPATGTPPAFKSKKPKAKQMPFYGAMGK